MKQWSFEHFLAPAIDAWIGRARQVDERALAAVSGLAPAVVVTGGSSGIGLAIARRFAAHDRRVVLVARDAARLAAAVEAIGPAVASALPLDVADIDAPARMGEELARRGLYLDVLVNNAALGLSGLFVEQPADEIEALLSLNVTAATRLLRAVLPALLARGRGGILNVASLGAYAPGPGQAAYYASKAYLLSLTEAVAWETRGRGIRICVVAPGPVDTPFHAQMGADTARYRQLIPDLSADAVAKAAVSGYVLGRTVVVPGMLPKLLMLAERAVPHPLLTPIIGWLLGPLRAEAKRACDK